MIKVPTMILILRGHIRNGFEDDGLYDFIKLITQTIDPDLKIYIHTWNRFASSLSWREIEEDNREVTEETIYDYFKDLKPFIKHIIIDNDKLIDCELIGNTSKTDRIGTTKCMVIAWKYMWYGIHKIASHVNDNESPEISVINTRFDLFKHRLKISFIRAFDFIFNNRDASNVEIKVESDEIIGCDNLYISSVSNFHKITTHFHNNLDFILQKDCAVNAQEKLLLIETDMMFNNDRHKTLIENLKKSIRRTDFELPSGFKLSIALAPFIPDNPNIFFI